MLLEKPVVRRRPQPGQEAWLVEVPRLWGGRRALRFPTWRDALAYANLRAEMDRSRSGIRAIALLRSGRFVR